MADYVIKVALTLRAPFLFSGLNAPTFGVDSGMLRNVAGELIVPHSLLRGNLRHIIYQMAGQGAQFASGCHPDDLFGRPTSNISDEDETDMAGLADTARVDAVPGGRVNWAPLRGILEFSDLVLDGADDATDRANATGAITRIALDAETGAVKNGALQVIESPFAVGEYATFRGEIRIGSGGADAVDPAEILKILKVAGGLVPAIGANKSSGFGRVEGLAFTLEESAGDAAQSPSVAFDFGAVTGTDFAIALAFDRPFLVNSLKLGTNVLKSDVNPSGAVIKGAMAAKLQACGGTVYHDYAHILDAIVVRNGVLLPVGKDGSSIAHRSHVVPKSLALYADTDTDAMGQTKPVERFMDGFCDAESFELYSQAGGCRFAPDWKDAEWGIIPAKFGAAEPVATEIRTRTAIDAHRGTAATSQLFSEICIVPENRTWQTIISHDLSGDDRAKFAGMMQIITDGALPGIGSTRARATMVVHALDRASREHKPEGDGFWRITLQSDAVLHPLSVLQRPGTGTARWLRQSYLDYWAGLVANWNSRCADKQLELDEGGFDFYASQRFAGGYLAARYPLRDDSYYPYFMTEAGSVFRIRLTGAGAADFIAELCRVGLPATHDDPAIAQDWRRFPFSPRLGFGEVSADAPDLALIDTVLDQETA